MSNGLESNHERQRFDKAQGRGDYLVQSRTRKCGRHGESTERGVV